VPNNTEAALRCQFQLTLREATLTLERHCHLHFDVNYVAMLLVFPAPERRVSRLFSARDDSL
ncbi:MAG: hypothetical protein VX349_05565, partial [Pseudomonadota bacterium]|nr:hypothetical protein [Pseudomonadota bacterium]